MASEPEPLEAFRAAVAAGYATLSRGDVDPAFAGVADDVERHVPREVPEYPCYTVGRRSSAGFATSSTNSSTTGGEVEEGVDAGNGRVRDGERETGS